jgi:hypothetical protein
MLEYGLHRFLFHIDEWLPDRPLFLTLHFLLHGIHHYLPMDRFVLFARTQLAMLIHVIRLRLVMPPALFGALQLPFTRLAYVLFPTPVANGIIAGAFTFCTFCFFFRYPHYERRWHGLRCSLRLHALRPAPHDAAEVYEGYEKVPFSTPLQEL